MPPAARGRYQTVAGFVMAPLGQVPRVADSFEWTGRRFEVVDMDGLRIDRVLVSRDTRVAG
jgi:putative hemolysin